MQKSKLISVIKTLSQKEFKLLGDFLASPYFNKNEKVIELYTYIKKYQGGDYEHPKLRKEVVFRSMYKGECFSDQKIRNLMRKLAALVETFLVHQGLEQSERVKEQLLLDEYMKRFLDKQYVQFLNQAQKKIASFPLNDQDYYYHQYVLAQYQYSFNLTRQKEGIEEDLLEVMRNLDYYYVASKLRYCVAILNRKRLFSVDTEVTMLDEILQYLKKDDLQKVPAIAFYYRLLLLIKDRDVAHYYELKTLLQEEPIKLPQAELRYIHIGVFNYCNEQLKSGKSEFLREIFDLFQVALKHELFIFEGYITPTVFYRNATMAALRLGEINWARTFIQEYKPKLRPDVRDSYYNYCLAALHFYNKAYRQTVVHLLAFEFQYPYQYMEHKILLAKTYYELEEEDALEALLHATRIYLHRDTNFPDHIKDAYKNFIRILSRLMKVRYAPQEEQTQALKELYHIEPIEDKEWLFEKMAFFVQEAGME